MNRVAKYIPYILHGRQEGHGKASEERGSFLRLVRHLRAWRNREWGLCGLVKGGVVVHPDRTCGGPEWPVNIACDDALILLNLALPVSFEIYCTINSVHQTAICNDFCKPL